MKKIVDALNSITGWSGTGTVQVNEHPQLIAGYNLASLIFHLGAGYQMAKTLGSPVDVTGYNELVFHVWSRRGRAMGLNDEAGDFQFSVKISGQEFLFDAPPDFSPVTISLAGITSITELVFKQVSGPAAYLVVSDMVAATDEIPVDIFEAVAEGLRYEMQYLGISFPLGVISATQGDKTILFEGKWIDKFCVIRISDLVNSEIHQVMEGDGEEWRLGGRYDGEAFLHDYTDATIEVYLPVEWGMSEKEIPMPGVVVWGMTPEPVLRSAKLLTLADSIRPDGSRQERRESPVQKYSIQIDVEAREGQMDILAGIYKAVRGFVGREKLWINGYRHYISVEGAPQWIEPQAESDQIFKATYTFSVEVKEDIWQRQPIVAMVNQDIDVEARL